MILDMKLKKLTELEFEGTFVKILFQYISTEQAVLIFYHARFILQAFVWKNKITGPLKVVTEMHISSEINLGDWSLSAILTEKHRPI